MNEWRSTRQLELPLPGSSHPLELHPPVAEAKTLPRSAPGARTPHGPTCPPHPTSQLTDPVSTGWLVPVPPAVCSRLGNGPILHGTHTSCLLSRPPPSQAHTGMGRPIEFTHLACLWSVSLHRGRLPVGDCAWALGLRVPIPRPSPGRPRGGPSRRGRACHVAWSWCWAREAPSGRSAPA